MKIIAIISRFLLGIVFIFSGFVKAIDPMGSTYKFIDYFTAFGMPFLEFIALPLAVLLSTAEFIIGICLFFGLRMKITAWAASIFMVFFTILTFFLAIFNPVTDCGCFGDAIILTNWQTFFKNLIFMVPTVIIFIKRNSYDEVFKPITEWIYVAAFSILIIGISIFGYRHLPIIDFRPYSAGTYIQDKMIIPEGAPQDKFESIFYYEKNGEVKEFTKDNYPWQDTTWKFVDAKHILIKEGYKPPIHDFVIENDFDGDITDMVLNAEGYYFLVVASTLDKSNLEGFQRLQDMLDYYKQYEIPGIVLTSSVEEEQIRFTEVSNTNFDFYNTDETTLKTIVRSNPGLVLLHEGTIIRKWHFNDLPSIENLSKNLIGDTIESYIMKKNKAFIYAFSFFSVLLILIFGSIKSYLKKLKLIKSS